MSTVPESLEVAETRADRHINGCDGPGSLWMIVGCPCRESDPEQGLFVFRCPRCGVVLLTVSNDAANPCSHWGELREAGGIPADRGWVALDFDVSESGPPMVRPLME